MFNYRLRTSRIKNKYTQQKLADALGLSLNAYQKYEQGERRPSYEVLIKIANILQVPVDFLLCRDTFLESLGVSVEQFL